MTPVTGTPDHVASMIRFRSIRRLPRRGRVCLAVLLSPFVLAGCMPGQPFVQDDGTGSMPEELVAVQRGSAFLPGMRSRFPSPAPSATLPASGAGQKKRSPGAGSSGKSLPRRRSLVRLSPSLRSGEVPAALPGTVKISPAPWPAEDPATRSDTWARIRGGLSAPYRMHPRVVREIGWYRKHKKNLHHTVRQARPYLAYIVRQVERRRLPIEFALLPIVESGFRPFVKSSAGAAGLWQFIPSTGRIYGLEQNWWYDGRRDVVASTRAALDYLSKLSQDFEGDWLLALAAYNWGEGNIRREVERNRARGKPADIWSLKLPGETRAHLARLLGIAAIVADPGRYGVVLAPIPDRIPFRQVELDGQIDLRTAADLAGITLDELHMLNPGFKRWATGPDGPHRLQLPRHTVQRFRTKLADASAGRQQPEGWIRHAIVRGDTLGAIASRYRTSVAALMEFNRLSSDLIHAGRHLMVPVSTRRLDGSRPGETMQARIGGNAKIPAPGDRAREEHGRIIRYRVEQGDSLWGISRQFGVTVADLREWNRLSKGMPLMPGRELDVHVELPPAI